MTDDDHPSIGGDPTEPDAPDGGPEAIAWPDPATEVRLPVVEAVPFDLNAMSALLRSVGIGPQEIEEAREHGHLELLAIEHLVLPEAAEHDLTEIAEATSLDTALIAQLWRSLGFVEPRPGDRIFTDVDVDMLRTIGQLLDMGVIDDQLTIQMARVIGSSLSRVATALIDAVDPAEPSTPRADQMRRDGQEFASVAPLLLPTLLQVMDFVWRRHVQAEARARITREHAGSDPTTGWWASPTSSGSPP